MNPNPAERIPKPIEQGRHYQTTISYLWTNYQGFLDAAANKAPADGTTASRHVCGFPLPDFQRQSVWTREQETAFIESAWLGLPLGSFNHQIFDWDGDRPAPYSGWLIDGQQRLTAIERYWNDEFKVFGLLYSELTFVEKRRFMQAHFNHYESNLRCEQDIRDLYNRLAFGGTPHSKKDRA